MRIRLAIGKGRMRLAAPLLVTTTLLLASGRPPPTKAA